MGSGLFQAAITTTTTTTTINELFPKRYATITTTEKRIVHPACFVSSPHCSRCPPSPPPARIAKHANKIPFAYQAVDSGVVKRVVGYTGWIWGRWFNTREMARLSIGPFLAEV